MTSFSIVVPTVGRPSLDDLLQSLAASRGPLPERVIVVDDRRVPQPPLTVSAPDEPLVHRMLECFERRTGLPVVVNTSLNTAGRPMVDDPRDALECFGSSPVDLLAIGPYVVRRVSAAVAA